MTTIEIRVATAVDIAAVDVLLARSYPALLKHDYAPSVLVAALPLISKAKPALVTCGTYYVAQRAGQVVGAGGWTAHAPTGGSVAGVGHIRHVVTDHRALRCGIGAALMAHVFKAALGAGMRQLECWSTLTAEPFYAAQGFQREAEIEVPIGPARLPFRSVRMRKTL